MRLYQRGAFLFTMTARHWSQGALSWIAGCELGVVGDLDHRDQGDTL